MLFNSVKTLSVALRQLYLNGFVGAGDDFDWIFQRSPSQSGFGKFNEAMNQAKGGITSAWPMINNEFVLKYPRDAAYKPNDFTCKYDCQSEEFFTFVSMALMGTLRDSRLVFRYVKISLWSF